MSAPITLPAGGTQTQVRRRGRAASGTQASERHASRITHHTSRLTHPRLIALLLFLAALLPRLPGLARFLTSDENTNIFFAGSDVISAFLRGDWRGTYWHFYPGVTMSWLDAVGMAGQYLLDILTGRSVPPFTEYIYGDILSLVVASRLPYAILTAVAVPVTYLLVRKLLPERVAILGALFMAFDPFYLAHSRVVHGDAPLAVFMLLSTLTFFIYINSSCHHLRGKSPFDTHYRALRMIFRRIPSSPERSEGRIEGRWRKGSNLDYIKQSRLPPNNESLTRSLTGFLTNPYLIVSAIFGGLAALTKAPGPFMALFVGGMCLLYAALEISPARNHPNQTSHNSHSTPHTPRLTLHVSPILLHWLGVIIIWGFVSLVVFILLWPSMWIDPIGTIRQMLDETFGKANQGHLVYFFGQPTLNPGPWFYFYVIPFRLTPIILIGAFLSLLLLIPKVQSATKHLVTPLFLLWLFTISLLLFGNLSPKKQDRYLLSLFPFLDLLAAIGWVGLFDLIYYQVSKSQMENDKSTGVASLISNFLLLILLLLHFIPTLTYYPYYLTYFNPLMGGPPHAAETTLMGWGEGMEQVAAYLNTKPDAENLYVASTPSQTLLPYFVGTGENFYTNDIAFRADYVVLYLAQMQRLAPSPEIVRYFEAQEPEKIITIKSVTYAKIYPGPKLILSDIPPHAKPINVGFGEVMRLAGYHVEQEDGLLEVDLFWHALPPIEQDRGPCYETDVENFTATICPRLNYAMSVRLVDAEGNVIVQHDSWPAGGLLPTSQWRVNDYVQDHHTLPLPRELPPGDYRLAVVVYEAQSQAVLAGPIEVETVRLGDR